MAACKHEEPKQNQVNKDGNQTRRNDDAIDVEYVSVEHLFLAVVEDGDSDVVGVCREFGLTRSHVLKIINKFRAGKHVTSDNPEESMQVLGKYGRDLTDQAR